MYRYLIHAGAIFAYQIIDMTDSDKNEMVWWLDELCAGDQADKYLELFPEMHNRLWKYAVGIHIWNMTGDIDISKQDDVALVRNILKEIGASHAFDYVDNVFNECSPEEVCEILGNKAYLPEG